MVARAHVMRIIGILAVIVLAVFAVRDARGSAQGAGARSQLTLIAPAAVGGGWDLVARESQQALRSDGIVNSVNVVNVPGAGGTIAANLAATANPDGHTLLSVSSAHAVAPAIYEKLPYDAQRDLAGVSLSAVSKYVLVWRRRLIVNPAVAGAITCYAVAFAGVEGISYPFWWVAAEPLLIPMAVIGAVLVIVIRDATVVIAYFVGALE